MAARPSHAPDSDPDFFQRRGYLHLRGFHTAARLKPVRQNILDALSRLGVPQGKGAGGARHAVARLPAFQQIARLSTLVKLPGLHETLATPEVMAVVGKLAGQTPARQAETQLLLSLAHQGDWSLAGLNWHVDVAANPPDRVPGIQAFYLIDDVVPHGGATLALAGSNQLDAGAARALRGALKAAASPEAAFRAAGVEVLEMSGRAGDVFLMDMRLLHTPSVNATRHIRMMATTRFLLGPAG